MLSSLEAPRASIATLARHFGFDAVETGGKIVFSMRGRRPSAALTLDDLVDVGGSNGEVIELERAQETELPQALKWTLGRSDEEYDAVTVEARRITVKASRIAAESCHFTVHPEEAEQRARRALQEAWAGRETATFALAPSCLALDPGDVVALDHDRRTYQFRLLSTADGEARTITAMRQDANGFAGTTGSAFDPPVIVPPPIFSAPAAIFLDLPQLVESVPAHQPLLGAYAHPWPGTISVFRSPETAGYLHVTNWSGRATIGTLVDDFYGASADRFDHGNLLTVDLSPGGSAPQSVTDLALFEGANGFAVQSSPGIWEIVQAAEVELTAPGRYRMRRLLRGQRGTEGGIGHPTPAGARIVMLNSALAPLPIAAQDLGLPFSFLVGPASRPHSDDSYIEQQFTPMGIGLRPFSPVHITQPWRFAREPGDLEIAWIRRDRALAADSWHGLEIAMSETIEAYEVDILDPGTGAGEAHSTVLRTLETDTTSVTYSSTHQIEDWGRLLGPGDTLDIAVHQLSATYGRGAANRTTLYF